MNIQKMLKQAHDMQNKLVQTQEQLAAQSYDGVAGGGAVKVTISGKGEMKSLALEASVVDAEEKELLEDLIVTAFNDAKAKADADANEQMGKVTGGMNLPAGMKLPF